MTHKPSICVVCSEEVRLLEYGGRECAQCKKPMHYGCDLEIRLIDFVHGPREQSLDKVDPTPDGDRAHNATASFLCSRECAAALETKDMLT